MLLRDLFHPVRPASTARIAVTAVGFPAIATGIAFAINRSSGVTGVSLYLLAVVLAAAAAGVWGGLVAATLSFAGYVFFFTAPRFTFRVAAIEDVVAAMVLLLVALVVGFLVARILDERERTERRERDATLLGYLATKLLSGEQLPRVLDDFAQALLDPFELITCEVHAVLDGEELRAAAIRPSTPQEPGPTEAVLITIGETVLGTVRAVRAPGAHAFTATEHTLLEATAKQAALAIERARLDTRVRGAQLEAETNQLRAALFSSVTHDLRTPLASIKASVTSLLSETAVHDAAQQRELLTTVLEETDRLNRVVGNLMDLAKIRAGALEPLREPAAVDELVQTVVARMRSQLSGVRVRFNIRPDLPDVFVDPVQIDQVLTNVLENAALHSPLGGEVSISAVPFRDVIQMRVADRGRGIAADERERVFEAFFRGNAAPERPGSGLGLAIARAIVVGHGGKIWVEGAPGGGTVVVFELPIWEEQG
jgi:two-component system, OmpR family, sensor histidine kinase KdpD